MTPKRRALTLKQLDTWLTSDHSPPESMMLSDLDGFLTGIVIGPEFIHPEEWLPQVWGEPGLVEPAGKKAELAIQAIVTRHNEIALQLLDEPEKFVPIFWQAGDGTIIPGDWAEGFMDAVKLRREAWQPLFKAKHERMLLAPILFYCMDPDGNDLLPLPPHIAPEILDEAHEAIPDCVIAICEFWKPYRAAYRQAQDAKTQAPRSAHRR